MTDDTRELVAVGYFVFRTVNFSDWMDFALKVMRAHIDVQPDRAWARLRLDEKLQRVLLEAVTSSPSFAVGMQARDAASLDRLAVRLRSEGLTLTDGTQTECQRRGTSHFFWFSDPDGNRLEAYVDLAEAAGPLETSLPIGGFRTHDLGAGHIVLLTPQFARMSDFYRRVLKLSLSDFCHQPFEAQFMHMNPRHHSLALLESKESGIHHVMFEYLDWDDVGRAYDEALLKPESIGQTLGRHSNDLVTSFYMYGPDRFMVELGWAGRLIGSDWQAEELIGPSLWGHERNWLPPAKREEARQVRAQYAIKGVRRPVDIPSRDRVS